MSGRIWEGGGKTNRVTRIRRPDDTSLVPWGTQLGAPDLPPPAVWAVGRLPWR